MNKGQKVGPQIRKPITQSEQFRRWVEILYRRGVQLTKPNRIKPCDCCNTRRSQIHKLVNKGYKLYLCFNCMEVYV